MSQSLSDPSISGRTLIFWDFGRPAESFAAVIKYSSGNPFLLVAEPEARVVDPTFDEDLFRYTIKTFLALCMWPAVWIEYDPGRDSSEGEELISCPNCGQSFLVKKSMYKPKDPDFAELLIDGQLAFLQDHFDHAC